MRRTTKAQQTVAKAIGLEAQATQEEIKGGIYKHTDCGAWIDFDAESPIVTIGSIVEGIDGDGTSPIALKWPFTQKAVKQAIADTEAEADEIWKATHGCDDCPENFENGYHVIDPECPTCHGEGTIL